MGKVININNNINKTTKKGQEDDPVMLLRATSDFYQFAAEIAMNYVSVADQILRNQVAPVIHMDPSLFRMNLEDMEDFTRSLKAGKLPTVYFYAVDGKTEYCIEIFPSEEAEFEVYNFRINKYEDGNYYLFNFQKKDWDKDKYQGGTEKMKKLLDSNSPEADILEEILDALNGNLTDSEYQSLKSKNHGLFKLYNQTFQYMQPYFEPDESGKSGKLYLEPKDVLRIGFRVGWNGREYVLYQYLDSIDFDEDEEWTDGGESYSLEAGRTISIGKMKECLKNMADRYTDDIVYTIPLSLEVVTEAASMKHIGRNLYFYCKRRDLTGEEQQALDAVKKAVRNFPISH